MARRLLAPLVGDAVGNDGTFGDFTITDDSSSTASWPDRLQMKFGSRVVQWWNEYGEWRGAPAKVSTVGWRIFAKISGAESRSASVPVMEVQDNRTDRNTLWSVNHLGEMTAVGQVQGQSFQVAGQEGVVEPLRIVGLGPDTYRPPIEGEFAAGDLVLTPEGLFLCTTGGEPGTWTTVGMTQQTLTWFVAGEINESATGLLPFYNDTDSSWRLKTARAAVTEYPTGVGSYCRVDIIKNDDHSMFVVPGGGPSIGISGPTDVVRHTAGSPAFIEETVDPGDYLTIDVDVLKFGNPAENLLVTIVVEQLPRVYVDE